MRDRNTSFFSVWISPCFVVVVLIVFIVVVVVVIDIVVVFDVVDVVVGVVFFLVAHLQSP